MTRRLGACRNARKLWRVATVVLVGMLWLMGRGGAVAEAAKLTTPEEVNTVQVYKRIAKSTVLIASAYMSQHHIREASGKSLGSGVLIDDQGLIVTNAHIVDGASKISVTLHDGTRLPARLVGSDLQTDVALLQVTLAKGAYQPAKLGNSDKVEIGQKVLAIGHPFGLSYALSTGIISGFGQVMEAKQEVFQERMIQTTAPINPGNSGGPLVDSDEEVIGISSAMLMGAQNIGFAIPINAAKAVIKELLAHGRVIRPWLGIKGKFITEDLRTLMALPLVDGLLVLDVAEGSPAAKIGLRAGQLDIVIEGEVWVLGGDIIVAVNDQSVRTSEQYAKVLKTLRAQDTVDLTLVRNGQYFTRTVTLDERPTQAKPDKQPQVEMPRLLPQGTTHLPF